MSLRLDWCSYAAAKYAVEHWHYSKALPPPPLVKIGVWECGVFIGCVVFGRGSNNNGHKPYQIQQVEFCELVRIALTKHKAPVSKMVSIAVRMLQKSNTKLRLIVSYADPNEGHYGGIYQAGGWIYTGQTGSDFKAIDRTGRVWHSRQVSRTGAKRQYGTLRRVPKHEECTIVPLQGKHRYLYPLDKAMREQIAPLAKPYPKRTCATSIDSDAPGYQPGESGAIPTVALQAEVEQA